MDLAGLGGVGQFDRPAYLWLRAHAAEHGWYDQAHFTRDFKALVGLTPARYREGR